MAANKVEELDGRVRIVEGTLARFAVLFDSDAGPGLISSMRETLSQKIDAYAATINAFIAGEPARKQHIENNAKQAVLDAKVVAEIALQTSEEKQLRLHQENRRDIDHASKQIEQLSEKLGRHEKFVQRGIGFVLAGQILIMVTGFVMTCLAFVGGFIWWLVQHAHEVQVVAGPAAR